MPAAMRAAVVADLPATAVLLTFGSLGALGRASGIATMRLLWGLSLGVVFPLVHRRLHSGLEDRERANRGRFGREAVTRPLLARLGTR